MVNPLRIKDATHSFWEAISRRWAYRPCRTVKLSGLLLTIINQVRVWYERIWPDRIRVLAPWGKMSLCRHESCAHELDLDRSMHFLDDWERFWPSPKSTAHLISSVKDWGLQNAWFGAKIVHRTPRDNLQILKPKRSDQTPEMGLLSAWKCVLDISECFWVSKEEVCVIKVESLNWVFQYHSWNLAISHWF